MGMEILDCIGVATMFISGAAALAIFIIDFIGGKWRW